MCIVGVVIIWMVRNCGWDEWRLYTKDLECMAGIGMVVLAS